MASIPLSRPLTLALSPGRGNRFVDAAFFSPVLTGKGEPVHGCWQYARNIRPL